MLTIHPTGGAGAKPATLEATALPDNAVWLDLATPTDEERAYVQRATGIEVPTFEELSEIESSSRLASEGETLYLSAPALHGIAEGTPRSTPVGYILSRSLLVTVRFDALPAFDAVAGKPAAGTGALVFVQLIETIVDRAADQLERMGAALDQISERVFRTDPDAAGDKRHDQGPALRLMLREIGQLGDLASKIRDSLLGMGRIVPYVEAIAGSWVGDDVAKRLRTIRHDITSLSDYDTHLNGKIQFLLDAILGFINIEQNNIIKVLTVVSVVGVPPTFLASLYGMNFKVMPELNWSWGYPYALVLMLISAVGPYIWFKRRGWF